MVDVYCFLHKLSYASLVKVAIPFCAGADASEESRLLLVPRRAIVSAGLLQEVQADGLPDEDAVMDQPGDDMQVQAEQQSGCAFPNHLASAHLTFGAFNSAGAFCHEDTHAWCCC